jgi:hypothetical protein
MPQAGSLSLEDPRLKAVLSRLHRTAGWGEIPRIIAALPDAARALARDGASAFAPAMFRTSYMAISPTQGRFLYVAARAVDAKKIVEFGSSYGISTLYLAAAAKDAGGLVIGSEFEREKGESARANLAAADLGRHPRLDRFRSSRRTQGAQSSRSRSADPEIAERRRRRRRRHFPLSQGDGALCRLDAIGTQRILLGVAADRRRLRILGLSALKY